MSWNDLSMEDKASYIRMGVENGITDLDTIREVYNKFAEGGPVKKSNYYYADSDTTDPNFTDLTPIGEGVYKNKFGKVVYDTTKVTPPEKDKSINGNWQTAYAKGIPSGTMASDMETMNAVTGGALNWTMPSQVAGATARLINDGDFGQFGRNLILGNSGIVTDNFAQEHPYWSLAANVLFDDVDYSYLDNYLGNKKSLGGNLYGDGGSKPRYRSSSNIRKQISTWEGATMKTNTPFEKMDTMFNQVLPAGALDKLSQKQLDGLYSFAYNVGIGRFKTRTAPTLSKYLAGQATLQDVQNTMWAAKDSKLRGLANRRKKERSMLGDYVPVQETIPMTTPLATSLDITPAVQPIIESNPVIQGNIETFPLAFNTESQKESYYTPGFFDYVNYINQIRQPKQRDRRIWLTI